MGKQHLWPKYREINSLEEFKRLKPSCNLYGRFKGRCVACGRNASNGFFDHSKRVHWHLCRNCETPPVARWELKMMGYDELLADEEEDEG